MKDIYLIKVWKQSKILFCCIILFIIFQVFFINKKIQNFPFFIFDMYSKPIETPTTFQTYEIKINNQPYNYFALTNIRENVILNTIQTYHAILQSDGKFLYQQQFDKRFKSIVSDRDYLFIKSGLDNDSIAIHHFTNWLACYLNKTPCEISILQNTYQYSSNTKIDSSLIAFKHVE